MEIILREDVQHLGRAGDVVKVKDGYARNYLLPKGLAYPATEANKKRITFEAERIAKQRAAEKSTAETEAASLAAVQLTFVVKVGEVRVGIKIHPDVRPEILVTVVKE